MENSSTQPKFKRVMIIDDTQMDRYVAERNIVKHAFADEVISKESARSALDYLEAMTDTPEELPQYIFLDIRMPEIDGFGFLELYEKLPSSIQKSCIIVMLSSSLDPEDHERAVSNKFVKRFLNKPLNKEQLEIIRQD